MSVDALHESRFGGFTPSIERLAGWAGRRANAPPRSAGPQPIGAAGWMERLGWALGGSFVTCCLALSWVEYRPTAEGIDVNLVFDPDILPERFVVSLGDGGRGARVPQPPMPGSTYVFDGACADHSLLETIHCVGAFFISPLASDVVFRVIEVVPITQQSRRHGGFGDWLIELCGSSGRRESGLTCRLTTHWTGEGRVRHLITNRLDLRSSVIFGIYKHRREIALFLEQVRLSPAQRFLLGSGKGLSPFRLFGTLLILRVWQWVIRRVRRGQQGMAAAVGELRHDVLGLLPGDEVVRCPLDGPDARAPASGVKQKEGLTASLLRSPRAAAETRNWRAADAGLTHG